MSGHGHVTPNADGSKARCGGPAICTACSHEAALKMAAHAQTPNPSAWEYTNVDSPATYPPCPNCKASTGISRAGSTGMRYQCMYCATAFDARRKYTP